MPIPDGEAISHHFALTVGYFDLGDGDCVSMEVVSIDTDCDRDQSCCKGQDSEDSAFFRALLPDSCNGTRIPTYVRTYART